MFHVAHLGVQGEVGGAGVSACALPSVAFCSLIMWAWGSAFIGADGGNLGFRTLTQLN